MKCNCKGIIIGCGALFLSIAGLCQDIPADRISVPLTDPSRPSVVNVTLMMGGITVKGHDGKEIIVEGRLKKKASKKEEDSDKTEGHLKRIDIATTGLTIEEENNVVSISSEMRHGAVDVQVQAPVKTSLKLSCVENGEIVVENIEGEIEANDLNGRVSLKNVSGVVVAHSLNGEINVKLDRVTPDKPMSFSTLNGTIDVTLPADTKATFKMESQNGTIQSDFEIEMNASPRQPSVEDGRKAGGKFRVVMEKSKFGTINGGGPEFHFKTMNGNIIIRKAAK